MEIRYLTDKDAESFRETLLKDEQASNKLGHSGGGLLESKHDSWNVAFTAEENEKLAGFLVLNFYTKGGEAKVGATFVDKEFRRKGVALKMLDFAEHYAMKNWPVRIMTGFTIENMPMEKCFKKSGYEKMGVYKKYVFYDGKYWDQNGWIKRK
jgi:RimJ/RimL family protein N-acetyltransferase